MKLTPEEADRLAKGIAERERRKREKVGPTTEPADREGVQPSRVQERNIRVLLPLDLWKAVHHAAIDLDQTVNEIATRALREFVERIREPK